MRSGYLWLASFVSSPLTAWPLLAHPGYRRFSAPCRVGLASVAGGVLISTWMTIFAIAGLSWSVPLLFAISLLTALLLRLLLRGAREPAAIEKLPAGRMDRAALTVTALAILAAILAAASAASTSPDLLTFWGPKAQQFARARTLDAVFLTDPYLVYMHRSYPPLVTNLYAFASMVAGRFPWGAATLTLPLCLGVLALSLPGVFRTIASRASAVAASAFAVAALVFLGSSLKTAGNADPWLWVFESLGLALLAGDAAATSGGQLLAGVFLAGAATAKVEGLPFAAAAALLFLVVRRREYSAASAPLLLLLPAAISLGAWFAFGAIRGVFFSYEQYGRLLEIHWSELGHVAESVGEALWSAGWAIPWLIPVAAMLFPPARPRLAALPLAVSAILAGFYGFTYLHPPDASLLIEWSAGRAFSPLVAFLATAVLCRPRTDAARNL